LDVGNGGANKARFRSYATGQKVLVGYVRVSKENAPFSDAPTLDCQKPNALQRVTVSTRERRAA